MSTDKNNGRESLSPEPTDYEVGYGKPPKPSRFAPGQSGNRKGRPRGSRNKAQAPKENRLTEIILAEAYRPIKVNDGKKRITVPIAEAIVRSLAVNAARGHLRSQQAFSKMLTEAEKALRLEKKQLLETVLTYKLNAEDELERRRQLGISGPEFIPHPDHIEIDVRTGEVKFTGPMSRKEKAELDHFDDRVEEIDRTIERLTKQLCLVKIKRMRDFLEQQLSHQREMRDMIVSRIGEPSNRRKS